MLKQLLVILLFFIKVNSAFGNIFIVSTNADSGSGSFREALTLAAANGTTTPDTIQFNLPDLTPAGRTIIVLSELPALSSNLVIDASTQPGNTFGVSGSRVKLQHSGATSFSQCFILNGVEDISIYSIYFSDFKYGDPNLGLTRCAILTSGIVKRLKIGAPGKGNVFHGNAIGIANGYGSGNDPALELFGDVELKSNFFGINEDGETMDPGRPPAIAVRSFRNVLIGGSTLAEGNYFSGGFNGGTDALIYMTTYGIIDNGFVTIENNTFGTNFTRTIPLKTGFVKIQGEANYYKEYSNAVITITKNVFNNTHIGFSDNCNGLVFLNNINGAIKITGNQIGTLTAILSCQTVGIAIGDCKNGIIGGDSPAEQNIIAGNYYTGLSLYNDSNIIVRKNSFYCNAKGIQASSNKVIIPVVKIMSTNDMDYVAGTAPPNCRIEVFQNPMNCSACSNGEKWMGETMSDNNGDWSFSAPFSSAVTARGTTLDSVSGEFSEAIFDESAVTISYPVCNANNGSIHGMKVVSGTKFYWTRSFAGQNDTILNKLDLDSLQPGYYQFFVEQTKYCSKRYGVILTDNSPKINAQYKTVNDPTCGAFNGSITGISAYGAYTKIYWLSKNRDTVGRTADLLQVGEGEYKLIVENDAYGCADSSNWIGLTNQSGPTLSINSAQTNFATCGNANGSISGITVVNATGAQSFQWVDSLGNIMGYDLLLQNVPKGKYKLLFKDQSACDTIVTGYFIVRDTTEIKINQVPRIITPVGCGGPTGSITNIQVTNATSFSWRDIHDDRNVGYSLDLINVPAGAYQLTARNAFGCSAMGNGIIIPIASFADIRITGFNTRSPDCNSNNGEAAVTSFNSNPASYTFRWIDSSDNQVVGTGTSLTGLGPGIFWVIAKDSNGCEKKILTFSLATAAGPVINASFVLLTNDLCSAKQGSIKSMVVSQGTLPLIYKWTDELNQVVGNSIDLENIGQGKYTLTVTDAGNCSTNSAVFTITNQINTGTTPQYDDQVIARNTTAVLKVKNFTTGTYSLYADVAGTQLVQQNQSGIFSIPGISTEKIFYVRHVNAACTSQLVRIVITPVDISYFAIPKAFTANNDNLNDELVVKVIGFIKISYFKIYNRYGQPIFETTRVNDHWDGKFKGDLQPTGAYIWIAEGTDMRGRIIRDKGTVMLIR